MKRIARTARTFGRWRARLAVVTLAGLIATLVALHGRPTWLAIVVWLLLGLSCTLATSEDRPLKLLGLAALFPIGLYGFLLANPGTHWYEAFLPMVLIVGAVGSRLTRSLNDRIHWADGAMGFALLLVLGAYPFYAFVPLWPRDAQMPLAELYRPSWSADRDGGSFGFPHQDGLKAIALIQEIGSLPQPYESNATPEVTRWYMPTAERCTSPGRQLRHPFLRAPAITAVPGTRHLGHRGTRRAASARARPDCDAACVLAAVQRGTGGLVRRA